MIECLGWIAAAGAVWIIAAPESYQRLAYSVFNAPDPVLRSIGVFSVALGLSTEQPEEPFGG